MLGEEGIVQGGMYVCGVINKKYAEISPQQKIR